MSLKGVSEASKQILISGEASKQISISGEASLQSRSNTAEQRKVQKFVIMEDMTAKKQADQAVAEEDKQG